MLYRARVELLEENTVVPAGLDRRNLVGCPFAHTLGIHALRHFHSLERVRLQKKGEGVPADLLSRQFFAPDHTVRCCLQKASGMNLGGLAELKGQHVCGNRDSSYVGKSVFSVEAACFDWKLNLFSPLVGIKCRRECSQRSVIVVPATPIIFGLAFAFEWKVMQHSACVALAFFDDAMKPLVRVTADPGLSVCIDLQG